MILEVGNVTTKIIEEPRDPKKCYKEIQDYLKVRVQGYQHTQLYKDNKWDGYKGFLAFHKFATGFLPVLLNYLTTMGIQVVIRDKRTHLPEWKKELTLKFGEYDMTTEQRKYQGNAVKSVRNYTKNGELYFPRGILGCATNAGKNLIAVGISSNLIDAKTLFIVHNKSIFKQAVKYFSEFFDVGEINDKKFEIKEFTIAMVKTLANRMKESINVIANCKQFNVVFIDEAHRAGAAQYSYVMRNLDAGVRIMLSGTALENEDDVKNMTIIGLSGVVLYQVSNQELIDNQVSRKPTIHMRMNKGASYLNYDEEVYHRIQFCNNRNNDIRQVCEEHLGKQIIVSFSIIEHGEELFEWLKDLDTTVQLVHGTTANREEILERFSEKRINILIASTIIQEGLNMGLINVLCYAMGGGSVIRLKQTIGRALRDNEDSNLDIYDWYDVGRHVEGHSRKRARTYKKEGFEILTNYPSTRGYLPKI